MPEDREELRQFLTMMLEDNYSDKTLERVWDVCEPSWLIGLGGHRVLYGMALEALEKKIAEGGQE
ncbi:MAG TPA: hypothetical protein PLG99_05340 [Kaistiaceae bacterium]|nr:hypothetical protein [Kaistiaceae bacterium]